MSPTVAGVALMLAAGMAVAAPAAAAPTGPIVGPVARCAGPLTLADALEHAASAEDADAANASAEMLLAGAQSVPLTLGNPQMSATAGARVTPSSDLGPEGSLGLSAPFAVGFAGAALRRTLRAEADVARALGDEIALQRRRAAALAFLDLVALDAEARVLDDDLAVAMQTRTLVERAVAAGLESRLALAAAQARESESRLARLNVEGETFDARVALADALGCADGGAFVIVSSATVVTAADLESAPDNGGQDPTLRRLKAALAAEDARIDRVDRDGFGQADVGVVAEKDGPITGRVLGTMSFTLPVFERGQSARAGALAERRRLFAAADLATKARVRALSLLRHEIEHTAEVLALIDDEALPHAVAARDAALRALEVAEISVLDVLPLERDVLALQRAQIAARAAHDKALVTFALLTSPDLLEAP